MSQLAYFGTDGIRGRYGKDPISEPFFYNLAKAIVNCFNDKETPSLKVVIGHDTRSSGGSLASAFCCALEEMGASVIYLGVASTPAIAFLTRHYKAQVGVSITASHNPARDNGIKFFDAQGLKLSIENEVLIENTLSVALDKSSSPENEEAIKAYTLPEVGSQCLRPYQDFVASLVDASLFKGLELVLDTANGATCDINTAVLKQLGISPIVVGNKPNGVNINEGVGSECPQCMVGSVLKHKAALGIAHDGDGDRVIFCDEKGSVLDGDEVIGVLALDALARNALEPRLVVVTIHSNTGLDAALKKQGVEVVRTDVGDRNVLHYLMQSGACLGGESSGHIILPKLNPAGDGLVAALQLLQVMARTQKPLSELRKSIKLFPKVTANIEVSEKKPLEGLVLLPQAIKRLESELQDKGRVLVRYSGTEPKIRLLVEGEDKTLIEKGLESLKQAVFEELQ